MKKGILIAGIVGVVIVAAGTTAIIVTQNKDSKQATNQENQSQNTPQAPANEATNIRALLAKGQNQKCTFSTNEASGTMYFTSGKMAADFTITTDGQTKNGKMIVSNSEQYFWETASNRGVKLAFSSEPSTTENNGSTASGLNADQNFDFKCEPWQVDNSLFTPPTNVTFIDLQNLESPVGQ